MVGAPFLLHETLGCPIANLHSARSDLWEPQFVLRPTQLRKKHCFVKSTSNDLTAVGITTCLPSELTSSLRIGEFPCRLLRTKNHHFAALRFPDFQRGNYKEITKGISRGCPLSPLLSALYLTSLDDKLSHNKNICYWRYMDDICVLAKKRWHLRDAIKQLNLEFNALKVKQHPDKNLLGE